MPNPSAYRAAVQTVDITPAASHASGSLLPVSDSTASTHLNNISSRLQFGSAKVTVLGNEASDGSSNGRHLVCNSNGVLKTTNTVTNLGAQGSLANGETFGSGNTSTVVDVSAINHANLLYSDTSGGGTIAVEVSGNGSAYYKAKDMAIDATERQAVLSIDLRGLSHIRLKAGTGFTNVVASVYGTA